MAISFEESKNQIRTQKTAAAVLSFSGDAVSNARTAPAVEAVSAYAVTDSGGFEISDKYLYYSNYSDDSLSHIDDRKNITVDSSQINLTQEANSQYIPFEMARYWDGIDLMDMSFLIHFVNANGDESSAVPVNVLYSSDRIRFGWLVDDFATCVDGTVQFEIIATGINEKGDSYIWKSRPNGSLHVERSLSGGGAIEPDHDWTTQFIIQVNEKLSQAAGYASEANHAAMQAQTLSQQAAASADAARTVVDNARAEITEGVSASVDEKVTAALADYYTRSQVDALMDGIDLSDIDSLAKLQVEYAPDTRTLSFYNGDILIKAVSLNSDPSAEWTASHDAAVDEKITAAVSGIQTDLEQKADAADLTAVKSGIASLESASGANRDNITALGAKVADLETAVENIDRAPQLTYEATYDENQQYTLWEIEGEGDQAVRTPKSQFRIQGGGGASTGSSLKIEYITATPVTVTVNDKAVIRYRFSGTDSSGDAVTEGAATWRVAGTVVATNLAVAGENAFDLSDYLTLGTQKVMLSITDDAGSLVTKTWTVQKIDVRLESSFNDLLTCRMGDVAFSYTPYGAVSKDVHFILDGVPLPTVTTSSSGIPMTCLLPAQPHGSHLLEVYMTAQVNGSTVESNHIFKDILWYDADEDQPVIGCIQQTITARQYDTTNIRFTVYDPRTETPRVTLAADGQVVSTQTLDSSTQIWQYKTAGIGQHTLTITCRDTVKTLTVKVEPLDISLEPVTAGLAFDFNPSGKSNTDEDRLWTDGDVSMTVSDNFDWVNGGYQLDDNGDSYFCVKAGTSAVIQYNLFEDDAKRDGKEFKLVFKTTHVRRADAVFLSCQSGTPSPIGLQMNVHEAYVKAGTESLYLPYSEEDVIEFEFNINKDTDIPLVIGYEDGVATRPMVYTGDHSFTQIAPVPITVGSEDCDVWIYRMKAYENSLNDRGILSNFIADARNADEMIARYRRNDIYDENQRLTPETLAERCPQLRIIKIDCPHFTNNKSDKVPNTTIGFLYKNGDPVLDNWTLVNGGHCGQGTTSNEYGAAGRNIDLIMNYQGTDSDPDYISRFTFGDGSTGSTMTLTRSSVPVNYLNVKVNIASSENANNALLQKRYHEYNPYLRPIRKTDSRVKDTMEFYNCVVFVRENDPDLSTHREFDDCQWHFYGMGNVGDSKKTDITRVNDPADPKECILEIMDNTLKNSAFPAGDDALADLDADRFDESGTYGWRYEMKGITSEQREANNQAWRDFYRFVVNSTDEEFKAQLGDWFAVDSALYFYLFTERYTMIDNRAKNTFWHYGKCEDGVYRWDLCFDYDNDTALGINNSGELTMTYGKEDTDYRTPDDPSSGYVFNAAASTFFCRIRDLMRDELQAAFVDRESQGCFSASGLIKQFDDWQSQFPEELWRLDIERKYIRSYRNGSQRFLREMMNGRKKYQRRQFERDQEKYMASKWFGATATSDQIMFRCNTPVQAVVAPDYTLHLTPYADMYLSVMFGAAYRTQVRAKAGKQYHIPCPYDTMDDTAVLIYCASQIQSMGDLSACYIHDNDFSKASRLQELIIGSPAPGYQNPFLTTLGIGGNSLLKKLDIQNTPHLAQTLNLSACDNLEELYASGSGITGVSFADGGKIRIARLPAISSVTMKNPAYLTDLNISSPDQLTTVVAENCHTIDIIDLLTRAPHVSRVRITGIRWTLDDTSLLERIYAMAGIDSSGYNISRSVLSGQVHVPVMRQKRLADYTQAWPDLEITYDTLIEQYTVTFANFDGTTLDVQYVDKGGKPSDPVTREDSPIPIPVRPSTVSTDFTYHGWDNAFTEVFENLTFTAVYTEAVRSYTVRYLSHGAVLQQTDAPYGSTVFYTGDTPTYTAEESAYKYYLFTGWDQSGFVNGPKDVNALYDSCEYNAGYFTGKELSSLRPVELYALTRAGKEAEIAELKDSYTFTMGNDCDYSDVESAVVIGSAMEFTGTNHLDTGIRLFREDRSFVFAMDYEFGTENTVGAVLAQCCQTDGANGFKLLYNSYPRIQWGTSSAQAASGTNREMLVIRHIAGETGLHVYLSNLSDPEVGYTELAKPRITITDATLVFGCLKADDGAFENHAVGKVYWAKVWYADLGDTVCRELAAYIHETVTSEMCGFKRKYLSDNSSRRCSMSFLGAHALCVDRAMHSAYTNAGGWAETDLREWLNLRFYRGIPIQMRQLIKQVKVNSSAGDQSSDISSSDCYIYIPAAVELSDAMTEEPYAYEDTTISYMINNDARKRTKANGEEVDYWTRSPNREYTGYYYRVRGTGVLYGYSQAPDACGIVIEYSI